MIFAVVGDVHGEFNALARAMETYSDAAFWLSVGDVASDDMRYPDPIAPFYWIQGNNEDFEFIASGVTAGLRAGGATGNLHFLPNGSCTSIDGIAVAALGGTFAPTWYETPAAELPYPGGDSANGPRHAGAGDEAERGVGPRRARSLAGYRGPRHSRNDKRRHFVREQVEALKAMRGVAVFLTHEAPRPFIVQAGPRWLDAGKTAINEVLAAMRPRLHFFGHHHRYVDAVRDGVRSIGLDLVSRSYVLVEADSFEVTKIDAEA